MINYMQKKKNYIEKKSIGYFIKFILPYFNKKLAQTRFPKR